MKNQLLADCHHTSGCTASAKRSIFGVPIYLLVFVPFLFNCSTAQVNGEEMVRDFGRGEFLKYQKIAEDNYSVDLILPCKRSQTFGNVYYIERGAECDAMQSGGEKTFVHNQESDTFRSTISTAQECFNKLKNREAYYLDAKGELRQNAQSDRVDKSLSEIRDRCDKFAFFWRYDDPVKLAFEKQMNLQDEANRARREADEAIAKEIVAKQRAKFAKLYKAEYLSMSVVSDKVLNGGLETLFGKRVMMGPVRILNVEPDLYAVIQVGESVTIMAKSAKHLGYLRENQYVHLKIESKLLRYKDAPVSVPTATILEAQEGK